MPLGSACHRTFRPPCLIPPVLPVSDAGATLAPLALHGNSGPRCTTGELTGAKRLPERQDRSRRHATTPATGGGQMSSAVGTASEIRPFSVAVPDGALDDLRRRIEATQWPERETVADDSQGVPLEA